LNCHCERSEATLRLLGIGKILAPHHPRPIMKPAFETRNLKLETLICGILYIAPTMTTETQHKIRVLVAKPGLDGHDRGAKVIARALRDAGMEVIYTGLRQTPEMIVNASVQEDVDVIGLSILSGAHNAIVPRVTDLLKQHKMDDVLVLVGGIIPDQDMESLKKAGVAGIFQPGTAMDEIIEFIRKNVRRTAITS
jgi:methylmalonyl-CoA mutase, C-terminal domain